MFRRTKICSAVLVTFGGAAALHGTAALGQELERVEITGSSIKRIESETALPVQVITRQDIQKTGATTVEQLMQTISAMSSSQGLTASSASGSTTGGISSVSLRGLGSARTLVLLNGRRLAPYGIGNVNDSVSVDVNSIPLSAIERVEILKDGASSIYGSDAIAGVVNFILRKEVKGGELNAEYGDSSNGGGSISKLSGTWGTGELATDRFNFMVVGSYQKEGSLFGRDRGFASHAYNVAENNDTTSGNTFPANIAAADGSFGSRNPTASFGCVGPYSFIDPNFPSNRCRFDPASMVTLIPASERFSLFATGKFAITEELQAFVEGSYNKNSQRTIIQPVPLSDQFTIPLNNPLANTAPYNQYTALPSSTVIMTSASDYYPTAYVTSLTGGATPDLLIRYRAAVNGNRDITDISEAPRLSFGVKGTAANWDVDSAFLVSQSKVREQVNDGYPILSKILPLLNSGTVNFFGPNTADVDAQLRATNFTGDAFKVTSTLTSFGAKASRDLFQLPGGPLSIAFGGEGRIEKYLFEPSTEWIQGDLSGYGGQSAFVDKQRKVASLFAETNIAAIKGLEIDAALRYDKYQGSGSSTTPKVSMRWQPAREVLFRGAVGKGFRAPSLADLYTPNTTGVSQTGLSDPLRCPTTANDVKDCSTQFPTINGGKLGLKSEKSNNTTLGMVFEPTRDISLGMDYFRIKLRDTISQGLPQQFILDNLDKYGALVTRGPVDPKFPTLPGPIISIDQTNLNTGETNLSGIDLDLKGSFPTSDNGRFVLAFNGTYMMNYDIQAPDGTFSGTVGNLSQATTGGVVPRWKTRQSITWSKDSWAVTAALNWQSGYTDVLGSLLDSTDPTCDCKLRRVGAYETYDLQATFSGIESTRLIVGVKNLFNRIPPYTNQGFSFQSGYDPQYADPRGRFIYASVSVAFK